MSKVNNYIYINNPKHKLHGIGAFFIHFKTNAGYTVKFAGDFYQVDLKDGTELPNVDD